MMAANEQVSHDPNLDFITITPGDGFELVPRDEFERLKRAEAERDERITLERAVFIAEALQNADQSSLAHALNTTDWSKQVATDSVRRLIFDEVRRSASSAIYALIQLGYRHQFVNGVMELYVGSEPISDRPPTEGVPQ
jgi:hypothetical protein